MQLETMYSEIDGRVATLTLNRPQVLNCADEQWARDLNTLVDDLAANDQVRVVVVRGAGRAFCSGIDLTALSEGRTHMSFFRNWESALRKLEAIDPVVIAAIHSHCIGGGLQVALACDLRIARDDAHLIVRREVVDQRVQVAGPLLVGTVEYLWTVERQGRHRALDFGVHGFKLHRSGMLYRAVRRGDVFRQRGGGSSPVIRL